MIRTCEGGGSRFCIYAPIKNGYKRGEASNKKFMRAYVVAHVASCLPTGKISFQTVDSFLVVVQKCTATHVITPDPPPSIYWEQGAIKFMIYAYMPFTGYVTFKTVRKGRAVTFGFYARIRLAP
jgi:hypothetical protein